jgi:hypothetical protein
MVFRRFRELRIFRQLRLKAPLGERGHGDAGKDAGLGSLKKHEVWEGGKMSTEVFTPKKAPSAPRSRFRCY